MDLRPFRLDIDELINEFSQGEMTTLADMKRIWLSKKFSCIFEAKPTTKLGFFMQSLYSHCIVDDTVYVLLQVTWCLVTLYHRGWVVFIAFTAYMKHNHLSLPSKSICVQRLKELVVDAKKENIGVLPILVKSMLERDLFLYGATDLKEGSVEERVNELTNIQDARVKHANKKLFADTEIERYMHMDMGKEFDLDSLTKLSRDYYTAKELAIKEAGKVVDTGDIKHIAENQILIGDVIGRTSEDWNIQKEMFYQKTGVNQLQLADIQTKEQNNNGNFEAIEFSHNSGEEDDAKDDFCEELEQELMALTES